MVRSKKLRVVATCTTLPDRYSTLVRTLECLHNQDIKLDAIYVTIPYVAKRLNKAYPPITTEMSQLATVIRVKEDYGPLCKLYGALVNEKDPNTIIISVDDDCIYPPTLVSVLLDYHTREPNVAICGTGALLKNGTWFSSININVDYYNKNMCGFNVPNKGRYIDLIHGFVGVLYKRSFFPHRKRLYEELYKYPLMDHSIFCHDDVIISGYLKKNKIKMMTFNKIPSIIADVKNEDALSYNFFEMLYKFNKSILLLKEHGMFLTYENTSISESPTYRVILFIAIIILIILFIYIIYKKNIL